MSRRKSTVPTSPAVGDNATAAATNLPGEPSNEVPADVTEPATVRGENTVCDSEPVASGLPAGDPQRTWRRHFEMLAVPEPGIYSGEDRKFAQVYIAFDKERPTDEQKAKMTEAGFRYRSAEKRWDAPSNAVTRVAAKKLVAEFTGVTLGAAQGR